MTRIVVEASQVQEGAIVLTEPQKHYLFHVMRVADGEQVEALVSGVALYGCQVGASQLVVKERHQVITTPTLTLAQALIKRDLFADVVERGTEAGVSEFIPLLAERSIVRDVSPAKRARWAVIAAEATEQSRWGRVPEISGIMTVSELCGAPQTARLLLSPGGRTLLDALSDLSFREPVVIVVGPEGGMSPREEAQLSAAGYREVSLGPQIYRAENAGVVAAALITAWRAASLSSDGDDF